MRRERYAHIAKGSGCRWCKCKFLAQHDFQGLLRDFRNVRCAVCGLSGGAAKSTIQEEGLFDVPLVMMDGFQKLSVGRFHTGSPGSLRVGRINTQTNANANAIRFLFSVHARCTKLQNAYMREKQSTHTAWLPQGMSRDFQHDVMLTCALWPSRGHCPTKRIPVRH